MECTKFVRVSETNKKLRMCFAFHGHTIRDLLEALENIIYRKSAKEVF